MKKGWKGKIAHIFGILMAVLVLAVFIYVLINYQTLKTQITSSVVEGGLAVLFLFCFLLEGFPTIIGLEPPVLAVMLLGIKFLPIMGVILIATILANWLSYFIGYYLRDFALGFVEKKNIKKYHELWRKYGTATMIITAVTPIPYIPAIAGIFRMNFWYFSFAVMGSRLLRHLAVFGFLYWVLVM